MINTPQKAELPATLGDKVVITTNGKDTLEVCVGKNCSVINRKDLYGLTFVLGDNETQDALMPARQTVVRKYVKQHRVKVKKDVKAGEELVVNCETDIPLTVEEGLRGLFGRRKSIFKI